MYKDFIIKKLTTVIIYVIEDKVKDKISDLKGLKNGSSIGMFTVVIILFGEDSKDEKGVNDLWRNEVDVSDSHCNVCKGEKDWMCWKVFFVSKEDTAKRIYFGSKSFSDVRIFFLNLILDFTVFLSMGENGIKVKRLGI